MFTRHDSNFTLDKASTEQQRKRELVIVWKWTNDMATNMATGIHLDVKTSFHDVEHDVRHWVAFNHNAELFAVLVESGSVVDSASSMTGGYAAGGLLICGWVVQWWGTAVRQLCL